MTELLIAVMAVCVLGLISIAVSMYWDSRRKAKRKCIAAVNRRVYGDGSPGVVRVTTGNLSVSGGGGGHGKCSVKFVPTVHHDRVDVYHHGSFSDTTCDDAAAGFVAGMAISEAMSSSNDSSDSFSGGGGDFGGGGASGSWDDSGSCSSDSSGSWSDSGSSDSGCSSD